MGIHAGARVKLAEKANPPSSAPKRRFCQSRARNIYFREEKAVVEP
jgi:hypothetical protein